MSSTKRLVRSAFRLLLLAGFLGACRAEEGCGGATCPFAVGGYARIRGTVTRADGTPYVAPENAGVLVVCGPGGFGGFRVPTSAAGAYELTIEAPAPLPRDTVPCALAVGAPVVAADTAPVAFGRERTRAPVTVVDLRLPAR